ncbi:hypothetical protein SLS60_009444 [Paraconiothyrium brasiliense]|uniref:Diphthamide biosynthesis protein 4 n=1 Tax=Paraconiothyrium brasiliense TaxID=300254 RepID=A0ABR3QUC5_9PLEO
MVFTQNYYTVLGLPVPPDSASLPQDALRKAYKAALLSAHPDKAKASASQQTTNAYTVDDVREALAVLSDVTRRAEFDRWLAAQRQGGGSTTGRAGEGEEDFILGLELLDLSDFEAGMPPFVRIETPEGGEGGATPELDIDFDDLEPPSPSDLAAAVDGLGLDARPTLDTEDRAQDGVSGNGLEEEEEQERDRGGEGEMEWTRECRCGAEKGFVIKERELEEAEARGEKEVLVGCEGCSLWVRVGFDVEEG